MAGLPLITSTPHFYNGEQSELEKFDGLYPNQTLHDTILDVETVRLKGL